jgi:hypothetical protein
LPVQNGAADKETKNGNDSSNVRHKYRPNQNFQNDAERNAARCLPPGRRVRSLT